MSFLQKKLTADTENVPYDWPRTEDFEVIENNDCFFGPLIPVIQDAYYKFDYGKEVHSIFRSKICFNLD